MSQPDLPLTVGDAFARYADRPFLILADGTRLTYRAFHERAEGMAANLLARGLKTGDRLLIQIEHSENALALYLACVLAGLGACPVDPTMPAARLEGMARTLTPKATVKQADLAALLAPPAKHASLPAPDETREFLIIYSSGTVGEPKGIVHTVGSMTTSARSFGMLSELSGDSVIYHHFPMFYMAGIFNMFFCPMMAGAAIVIGARFSGLQMLRFWDLPKAHGVNHLTLTPTMAHSLSQLYRSDDALLEKLQHYQAVISTGSLLYDAVAKRFNDTFGIPLRSCYGVTEVGGSITLQSWVDALAEDGVGSWRPETHLACAGTPETPAEIFVRTPFMMKGYLTSTGLTDPRREDGSFPTGDFGHVRDGKLYVTGRENDVVKKGGEFISLPLVESFALGCDKVTDAAAVAVPDEYWGSRHILFYVPAQGATMDEVESKLTALFNDRLRKIEQPDKMIAVPWFPKTSIGKTIKRDLIRRYTI